MLKKFFIPKKMQIFNTLLPVFLIVFLGTILRASGFVPETTFKQTNRLVYWIGLPCLIFDKTSVAISQGKAAVEISMVLVTTMVISILIAYGVAFIIKVPIRSLGAFVQGAVRSNLNFVGLPVVLFALALQQNHTAQRMDTVAVLAIAPLILLYNIVSVIIVLLGNKEMEAKMGIPAHMKRIFTNPLIIASILGIAASLLNLQIPVSLKRGCSTLGQMALPLALLGVGATLQLKTITNNLSTVISASLLKIIAAPLVGYFLARMMSLSPDQILIALLFLACPTAIASYVLVEQLKGDEKLASNIIISTTLLSIISLGMVLWIFGS